MGAAPESHRQSVGTRACNRATSSRSVCLPSALSYQEDLFSGFQYQASASGGIGYKFINTTATRLSAQVGTGYRSLRPQILIKDADGAVVERIREGTQSDVVATAGVNFEHAFNTSTKLTDKLLVESGSSNTSLRNDLALEVKMAGRLSLAAGYSVIENTSPPDNLKKVDTTTTLNLVYSIGQPAGKAAAGP